MILTLHSLDHAVESLVLAERRVKLFRTSLREALLVSHHARERAEDVLGDMSSKDGDVKIRSAQTSAQVKRERSKDALDDGGQVQSGWVNDSGSDVTALSFECNDEGPLESFRRRSISEGLGRAKRFRRRVVPRIEQNAAWAVHKPDNSPSSSAS